MFNDGIIIKIALSNDTRYYIKSRIPIFLTKKLSIFGIVNKPIFDITFCIIVIIILITLTIKYSLVDLFGHAGSVTQYLQGVSILFALRSINVLTIIYGISFE